MKPSQHFQKNAPLQARNVRGGIYAAAGLLVCVFSTSHAAEAGLNEVQLLRQKIELLERRLQLLESKGVAAPEPERIGELDQKVRIVERSRKLEQEAAEAKAKETPKLRVGEKGFGFSSGDGNFGLQLKGVLQLDSRTFLGDSDPNVNDGLLLRRARPILQGTVFRDFDFLFVPEFGGSGSPQIFDAYLNYRYSPALQFQAGKFKTPVGLEQLQADKDVLFNERSLVTDLVPNRDLGFQVHGEVLEGAIDYSLGLFNEVGDGRNSNNLDTDSGKALAGRLFFQPFKTTSVKAVQGLGFGIGGSYEDVEDFNASGLPSNSGYATIGQQLFFTYRPAIGSIYADGVHWRLSPQAYYYYGPFSLMGEYAISSQGVRLVAPLASRPDELEHTAWQVSAAWVLTGEDASFKGVVPRHSFDPREGHWGAFQLAARYSQLDIDEAAFPLFSDPGSSARSAQEWSVGLNWYLNKNVRVGTSYTHTEFEGGGGAGSDREDEDAVFTRIQLAF